MCSNGENHAVVGTDQTFPLNIYHTVCELLHTIVEPVYEKTAHFDNFALYICVSYVEV